MKTVKVIAKKQHVYDQLPRKAGETYDIEERHLDLFERMGNVVKAEVAKPEIVDRELISDPPPKGRYQRRDLRAKE